MNTTSFAAVLLALLLQIADAQSRVLLRVGHFPNVTHAQALVAHQLSRQGKGWFESRLGPDVEIHWFTYNAGPTAMEAILAGMLDLSYVGPNPALNAYVRSDGEALQVIAGAARGGSALVVRRDAKITTPADFRGRTIATPQFGNTQDVACRAWLNEHGLRATVTGGDVRVVPTTNPDQWTLFQRGKLDAVWTVEPWVSRLELDAGGKVFLEDEDALTTLLVVRMEFLELHRRTVREFGRAHADLTRWINEHPTEARKLVLQELADETRREFRPDLLERAWARITFTDALELAQLERFVTSAKQVGFLKNCIPLDNLLAIP